MNLCNCDITPNPILKFHRTTHLEMDATIGCTYSVQHDSKPNTWREMEQGKCQKYQRFYQRQRLAFTTMITNSLGQCAPDLLMFGFSLDENTPQSSAPSTQQAANYRKLRGQKHNENHQRILTYIFEGITTVKLLVSVELLSTWLVSYSTPNGLSSFNTTGLPLFPKIDLDLVSSHCTAGRKTGLRPTTG